MGLFKWLGIKKKTHNTPEISPSTPAQKQQPPKTSNAIPPPANPDPAQKLQKATNGVNWVLDLPEPFQGRSESTTPIQLDLTQKTVNTIGAAYKTLHNWKTVVGPDQVFISCDVPLDVELSVFKATFKEKTPGIAFTDARSPSPLIRFGLLTWEQCCKWKLDTLGVKEPDPAAQMRSTRIDDGLAYELKVHVEELINIGRQTDAYVSGRFLDPTQSRTREIGRHLNQLGRRRMMLAAHSAVRRQLGDNAARELEVAWNGIEDWQG